MVKKYSTNKYSRGMTYVEIIVVLSIFSILTAVSMYNYGAFQSKVDIKNLASDIALKITQAQKDSSSGKLPPPAQGVPSSGWKAWKPAYGVYFNSVAPDDKNFIYFSDLNIANDRIYQGTSGCSTIECIEKVSITKGNNISAITVAGVGTCAGVTNLSVVFTRPDSSATMNTNQPLCTSISSANITVHSPKGNDVIININNSGRIQIN